MSEAQKKVKTIIYPHEAPIMRVGTPELVALGGDPKDHGFNRTYVSREVNGSDDLAMGVWTMKPGEVHTLHYHPNGGEIYYVISGTALFTVGDEVVEGTPGTSVYMPPRCKHAIEVSGDEPLVIIWAYSKPTVRGEGGVGIVRD